MENESKIIELLSEMLHKFDVLTEKVGKVETEIVKLNAISAENSRALLKMGDYNETYSQIRKSRL